MGLLFFIFTLSFFIISTISQYCIVYINKEPVDKTLMLVQVISFILSIIQGVKIL